MGRKARAALAGFVLLLCLSAAARGARLRLDAKPPDLYQLGKINRSQLLQQVDKQVTVEGYFYDGSIPLIVDNMETVAVESAMSPDKYIPIAGPIPSSFKSGAKVRITGQVQKPTGEDLKDETAIIRVPDVPRHAVLQAAPPSMSLQHQIAQSSLPVRRPTRVERQYALLIGGGKNQANNYLRYWRDLWQMYQIMVSAGYHPANIRVAYSNGQPRTSGMPVNYPANLGGIHAAFSYFVSRMGPGDTLYILVCGQGASPGQIAPTAYWTWPDVPMRPNLFAAEVNRITDYARMVIHMNQSYSGGFISALRDPKRIIVTAAAENRDAYCHASYLHGNFNFWYLSALAGQRLLGGPVVDADVNDDGHVSIAEAYNFTLPRPGWAGIPAIPPIFAQRPQVEDTGTAPSYWGPLPASGEGAISAATHL